jgi:Sortase domain
LIRIGAPRTSSGAHRLAGLCAVLAGVVALGVAVFAIRASRPAPNVGVQAARGLAASRSVSPSADPLPAVPIQNGSLPTAAAVVAPTGLAIPALAVNAVVVPVGVTGAEADIPADPMVVGWYRFGPGIDADAGSTVLTGHVDTVDRGRGALFRLRELTPGARVQLTGPDGRARAYRVVAREEYPKSAVPFARYFARDGAPRLALITCGGPFDTRTRHYRDNVVVTAEPV